MSMPLRSLVAACAALLAACAAENPALPSPARSSGPSPSTHVESPKAPKPATASSAPAKPAETTPPKHVASSAPAAPKPKPSTAATPPAAAPLDLKALEARLKETNAIGVLTKLSLKNQVDDLVANFRAYHQGVRPPTLSDLRPAFELLVMKVLSLLQDRDPALAHDVSASRDAIWGVLTDPRKLAQFS